MINKQSKIRGQGFTLIELLVVVAIIGLLSSIISFAVTGVRVRARDAKRVSDMKQIISGMDLFFQDGQGYPDTSVWDAAVGGALLCSGIQVLLIPHDPGTPLYSYTYAGTGAALTGCGVTVRQGYEVEFYIENQGKYYLMDEDGGLRERDSGAPASFDSII